jgi:hypothetical protein
MNQRGAASLADTIPKGASIASYSGGRQGKTGLENAKEERVDFREAPTAFALWAASLHTLPTNWVQC